MLHGKSYNAKTSYMGTKYVYAMNNTMGPQNFNIWHRKASHVGMFQASFTVYLSPDQFLCLPAGEFIHYSLWYVLY
jgi:hypothetical protein